MGSNRVGSGPGAQALRVSLGATTVWTLCASSDDVVKSVRWLGFYDGFGLASAAQNVCVSGGFRGRNRFGEQLACTFDLASLLSQQRELGRASRDAFRHVDCRIEIPGFFPKQSRLFSFARFPFEYGHAPNGVRRVERGGFRVAAIESESFVIAGRGQFGASLLVTNIAQVADGVCQSERFTLLAIDGNGFLIVLPCGITFTEVPLDLSQTSEDLRQLGPAAIPPQNANGLGRIPFGVGKPILSSRPLGLSQQLSDCAGHCASKIIIRAARMERWWQTLRSGGYETRSPTCSSCSERTCGA